MTIVSIVKCKDYEYKKLKKAIKNAIDFIGGLEKFIKDNDKVLIKPNLCNALSPENAITTHPLFIMAISELVKEFGLEVWIGDGSAGTDPSYTDKTFEISGVKRVAEELDIKLINFHRDKRIKVEVKEGKILKEIDIPKCISDVDMIINLPKLKVHGLTFYTGSIKNIFGCLSGNLKKYIHMMKKDEFSQALLDIYSTVKPDLTLMDAVLGLEGENISHGNPKKVGLVLSGTDGVAVDTVACEIIGYHSLAIPTIKFANKRKIGIGNLKKIKIIGNNLEKVKIHNFKKSSIFFNQNIEKKENDYCKEHVFEFEIIKERCIKCWSCARSCPTHAIKLNPYPSFNRERCIHCYCCYEVCSQRAIQSKIST